MQRLVAVGIGILALAGIVVDLSGQSGTLTELATWKAIYQNVP